MVSVVNDIKTAISEKVKLRPGTSVAFSGQFELLEHANKKLKLMVPMTVMIISSCCIWHSAGLTKPC